MEINVKKYIIPVLNDIDRGVVVIVGNLVITAGHVVGNSIVFLYQGKEYTLYRSDALIYYSYSKEEITTSLYDLCIFRVDELWSPLVLTDDIPSQCVESISCKFKENGIAINECIFTERRIVKKIVYHQCLCSIMKIDGKYFHCDMTDALEAGFSGSPILDGNKVYGVLIAGEEGEKDKYGTDHFALYLSSKSILEVLRECNYVI